MELYSDLVLAVIYFKFNIHTEYSLLISRRSDSSNQQLGCNRQNSTPIFWYARPLYNENSRFQAKGDLPCKATLLESNILSTAHHQSIFTSTHMSRGQSGPYPYFVPPLNISFFGPQSLQRYNYLPPPNFFATSLDFFLPSPPLKYNFTPLKQLQPRTTCGIAGYLIISNAVSAFPFCQDLLICA